MRYTPTDITSTYAAITALNVNFDDIQTLLEKCVFTDGTPPNAMEADFDMNHFNIKNVADAVNPTDAINLEQATSLIGGVTLSGDSFSSRALMAIANAPVLNQTVLLAEKGREGNFVVDLASNWTAAIAADTAQGLFVPSTADATKVYRRVFDDVIHARWFGGAWDGVTDDSAAILAAIAVANALKSNNITGFGSVAVPPIQLPFAPNGIYVGTTKFSLLNDAFLRGYGGGFGSEATLLKWDAGTIGIEIHGYNCRLEGLSLQGGWLFGTTNEGEFHALKAYSQFAFRDLFISKWQGDGVHVNISEGSGGDTEGNANVPWGERLAIDRCRVGISLAGSDVNAGNFVGSNVNFCRQAGVYDNSFLGNTHVGPQTASNGITDVGGTVPFIACFNNGHLFYCVLGQEAGASTNSPPSTATSNTWWRYWEDAAAQTYAPQWTSGMLVRAGGSYLSSRVNGQSIYLNPYAEGDQPPMQLGAADLVLGGQGNFDAATKRIVATVNGLDVYANFFNILAPNFVHYWNGQFLIDGSHSSSGVAAALDPVLIMQTGNTSCTINFNNAAGTNFGYILANASFGLYLNHTTALNFRVNGVDIASVVAAGINLDTGKVLQINGTQVVGPRVTGFAADTGTALKTANATYAKGSTLTYSATYTQSEQTAGATRIGLVETALQNATQELKAIKDALIAHGLIGA